MHPEAKQYWNKWMAARKALRAEIRSANCLQSAIDRLVAQRKRIQTIYRSEITAARGMQRMREAALEFREAAIEREATAGLEASRRELAARLEGANAAAKRFESAAQCCLDINDALLAGRQGSITPAQEQWLNEMRAAATANHARIGTQFPCL